MSADIEQILVDYLAAQLQVRTCTELPAELAVPDTLPIVQVEEVFGPGESVPSLDVCDVDIDAYAETRPDAKDLAERVRSLIMYDLPGRTFANGLVSISKVSTDRKPSRLPYDDSGIRRFGAAYRITVHSRA